MRRRSLPSALLLLVVACGGKSEESVGLPKCEAPVAGMAITTRKVGDVVGGAMLATSPPADLRLFVVEQRGAIRIFSAEKLLPDPFLDLSVDAQGPVRAGGELGMLGLAFHPKYATNGFFYVFYTSDKGGALRDIVTRCTVSAADPNKADLASCVEILAIPDFAGNHNGGMIEFGKDGYLYIGTGDGGSGGDPRRNSQTLLRTACTVTGCEPLLGKILRIDVSGSEGVKNYKIPTDNPYADGVAGEPEIFARGLRNPWRWAFDKQTGDMWIGDVGQSGTTGRQTLGYEEIDFVPDGTLKDKNFGWSNWEGGVNITNPTTDSHCYCSNPGTNTSCNYPTCATAGFTFPQIERDHANDGFLAIIGGDVYRGTCYPDLVGTYFFGDNSKRVLSKATVSGTTVTATDLTPPATTQWPAGIASIHKDARGELYLTTASGTTTANGRIYHIEAGP